MRVTPRFAAAAELDSIIAGHVSTDHQVITTSVDETLDAVTSDLISVFKASFPLVLRARPYLTRSPAELRWIHGHRELDCCW